MTSSEIRTKQDCLKAMQTVQEFIAMDGETLKTSHPSLRRVLEQNNLDRKNDLELLKQRYSTLPD